MNSADIGAERSTRVRLDASGWAEILARPRSFVSGDPLPAEICEALGTAKILVLSLLLPQFVPDGIPPGIPGPITWVGAATGAAMATKPGKRLLMRLAADNLKSRHVLVNDEATDEQLFRFEINMVHDQWLPVAVFRPAEVEVDETGIRFVQTLGAELIGPTVSTAEEIIRSRAVCRTEETVAWALEQLDPHVKTEVQDVAKPVVVEHHFSKGEDACTLHHRIVVSVAGAVSTDANRIESWHVEEESPIATPLAEPLVVNFEPGPLGIVYEGRHVVEVIGGGQSERCGVRVGMCIDEIDGCEVEDDSRAIKSRLACLKDNGAHFTMRLVR